MGGSAYINTAELLMLHDNIASLETGQHMLTSQESCFVLPACDDNAMAGHMWQVA